jgi:hypothetical protein
MASDFTVPWQTGVNVMITMLAIFANFQQKTGIKLL